MSVAERAPTGPDWAEERQATVSPGDKEPVRGSALYGR